MKLATKLKFRSLFPFPSSNFVQASFLLMQGAALAPNTAIIPQFDFLRHSILMELFRNPIGKTMNMNKFRENQVMSHFHLFRDGWMSDSSITFSPNPSSTQVIVARQLGAPSMGFINWNV